MYMTGFSFISVMQVYVLLVIASYMRDPWRDLPYNTQMFLLIFHHLIAIRSHPAYLGPHA